jgi:DNA polymerase-3 subunit epsilon
MTAVFSKACAATPRRDFVSNSPTIERLREPVPGCPRRICVYTETTGLSRENDRICEIGAVEIDAAGNTLARFHAYVNPKRSMPYGAYRVHGLSSKFLADKPDFSEVAPAFLNFVRGASLIAHNMPFDAGFLNAELARNGFESLEKAGCSLNCTLRLSRKIFPSGSHTLDSLCERLGVDRSAREGRHGALIDSEILVGVLLRLEETMNELRQ